MARRRYRIGASLVVVAAVAVACGLDVTGTAAGPTEAEDAGREAALPPPSNPPDAGGEPTDSATGGCGDLLTDPKNCGECAHSCLGAMCANGMCEPTVLMTGLGFPSSVAIEPDGGAVYVAENGGGVIYRAADDAGADAGGKVAIFDTRAAPRALAYAGGRLFWVEQTMIRSIATDGSDEQHAAIKGGSAVVPSGDLVFFNDIDNEKIQSRTLALGSADTIVANEPDTVGVALNASDIFWTTSRDAGTIGRNPRGTDTPSVFVLDEDRPESIAAGPAHVFWTTRTAIRFIALADGGADGGPATLYPNEGLPRALIRDGARLYWFEVTNQTLRRGTTAGGNVLTLARGEAQDKELPLTTAIAVDGAYVYWISTDNGTLKRVPK